MTPAEATEDHVIARSWYPANTPPIAKWKVPACNECNNRYSAAEQNTLCRLAFCVDPKDQTVRRILERARRSIEPKHAKSPRDIQHRFNKRAAIIRGVKQITDPRGPGVLPSFRRNFWEGSRTGIAIPAGDLKAIVAKWVRGIHFCEIGQLIPAECEVAVQFVEDSVAAVAFAEISQFARRVRKGPGVEVLIWHAEEGNRSITQYAFFIWRQFRAYGSVECGGATEKPGPSPS